MNFLTVLLHLVIHHLECLDRASPFNPPNILQAVLVVGFLPLGGCKLFFQYGFDDPKVLEYIGHMDLLF